MYVWVSHIANVTFWSHTLCVNVKPAHSKFKGHSAAAAMDEPLSVVLEAS